MASENQQGSIRLSAESEAQGPTLSNDLRAESKRARRRIFFLLDTLNIGGTETQAVELAKRLDPGRYEVTLGCLRAQGPLLERLNGSAVTVREFYPEGGFDSAGGIYQMFRLALYLRRGGFHIVHTHDLYSNLLGIPAALMARTPVIISSRRDLGHLDWYQGRRRTWLRRLQNLSTVVLANCGAIRESLVTEDGFKAGKIRVIYNGIEIEMFSSRSRKEGWREQGSPENGSRDRGWLIPESAREKWVVMVANMHSDGKGHPWLIEAAVRVLREFPELRFLLVGDGAQRQGFEQTAARLGVQERFMFLGRRDDVARILACCDVGVLPSLAEGLPNAVLEYLAAGLPTIATRVGGNSEIIEDEVTGLLVPPRDSTALSGAILRLLRNPELAAGLAQRGQKHVATHFSFDHLIRNTDQLYAELLRARELE